MASAVLSLTGFTHLAVISAATATTGCEVEYSTIVTSCYCHNFTEAYSLLWRWGQVKFFGVFCLKGKSQVMIFLLDTSHENT